MELLQKLKAITGDTSISTKTRILLVKGLKQTLQSEIAKPHKQANRCSKDSIKKLASELQANYKCVNSKLVANQSVLLNRHRICLQQMNCPLSSMEMRKHALGEMRDINRKLRDILEEVVEKKRDIEWMSKEVQGHFTCRKIKKQIQQQEAHKQMLNKSNMLDHPSMQKSRNILLNSVNMVGSINMTGSTKMRSSLKIDVSLILKMKKSELLKKTGLLSRKQNKNTCNHNN